MLGLPKWPSGVLTAALLAAFWNPAGATARPASAAAYPPPSTESQSAKFVLRCPLSHRAPVDPIVAPGPRRKRPTSHLHDFFGNRSTDSDSTYDSMLNGSTTCALADDTAAYWAPTLKRRNGRRVRPVTAFAYYRNRPVRYGTTTPFPPDFRMIAGGHHAFPDVAYWNCHGDDSEQVRRRRPRRCRGDHLVAHVLFPNCWDGVRTDSRDHRSHVVHPRKSGSRACPPSHPVKLPQIRFFVRYPEGSGGRRWRLSDGERLPHADFWNTWRQPALEDLVDRCLRAGRDCGKLGG